MITAAALCPAAPLLARELTGSDPVVPELRQACLQAVGSLLRSAPALVVIIGVAGQAGRWPDGLGLDLSGYAPGLGPPRPAIGSRLPLPLGLGDRLLDQAGYRGRRQRYSVSQRAPARRCASLGGRIAAAGNDVAVLVMADGSARRGRKAPGYEDERSIEFDAGVERAFRAGDLASLLELDAGLAAELMATGRPAWQVLAGATIGLRLTSEIHYCDDPFGVAYLVASLAAGGQAGAMSEGSAHA